ncbi:uncharacterized protein EV420DRAFT_1638754 [Desarmillaria tabescens]|uniref:RING-type domain-containing protein n=1 Tax=Armillaria tabescens TaxID=1929756 RepID=A0AA39TUF6_ARMTA|nr:uncharacterized protein EV420DRAFT_1638754 [Desarmillaria tabescens]KAK0463844.1 hypothetical protein EV420DRAFT_1638754 [Desarmillaria tabescens]
MPSSPPPNPVGTPEDEGFSDEMEPVRVAIRALVQANHDLVHRLHQLETSQNDLWDHAKRAEAVNQQLDSFLQDELQCPCCNRIMWIPYQMQCGHSACFHCCTSWYQHQHTTFERDHPGYNPRAPVSPSFLFDPLATSRHVELWEFAALVFLLLHPPTTRPQYTCPCCPRELTIPPIENRPLRNIVYAWAQHRGLRTPPPVLRSDWGIPLNHLTLVPGWSSLSSRLCQALNREKETVHRYQEDADFLWGELHRASEHIASLEWRLTMQIAYTRALTRRRRNAACHAGRTEEELRHIEEQRTCDEGMFDAQWEENRALRFRLARLELREVLSGTAEDNNRQGQTWEESLTCEFCYGTLCCTLALRECGHSFCVPCLWVWFKRELSSHPDILRQPTCPECHVKVLYHPTIDYRLQNVASQLSRVFPQSDCEGGLAHKLGYRGSTSWDDFDAQLRKLVEDGVELR